MPANNVHKMLFFFINIRAQNTTACPYFPFDTHGLVGVGGGLGGRKTLHHHIFEDHAGQSLNVLPVAPPGDRWYGGPGVSLTDCEGGDHQKIGACT